MRIILVLALLLAGCTTPSEGPDVVASPSAEPVDQLSAEAREEGVVLRAGWQLREVTADGRQVALVVEHGACDGYLGPRVTADTSAGVAIEIAYDPPQGVVSCNAIGLADREVVQLPTPLAGRSLTGCGYADCRTAPEGTGFDGRGGGVAVAAGVAVVVIDEGVVGLDVADGREVWRIPRDADEGPYLEDPTALADLVLLVDQLASQDVIAVDAATGEIRWEASGRNPFGYLRDQVTASGTGDELALLTPGQQLVQTAEGWQGGVVEARRPDGTIAWTTPVEGQVFETDIAEDTAVVLSGRNMDADDQLGTTQVTVVDVASGAVRWQTPLPGQPFDAVVRPTTGDAGLVVVDVLGATYGLALDDGSEVWRNLPLNYGGMVDVGPAVLLSPGRYGDPYLLLDPATGAETGTVDQPTDIYGLDVSRYPLVDGQVILPQPGALVRRDVLTIPLTQPDPAPAWSAELFAQAGPPSLSDRGTVVVPTPLGARAHDVATGELVWAFADLPG
ncbi:MAG: PQQ-binding-like beta-propeller repeat protein [Euzebya sp.]